MRFVAVSKLLLAAAMGLAALIGSDALTQREIPLGWSAARKEQVQRSFLPESQDRDRDGLDDREELLLATRYAPVVTLHPRESALPASVSWLAARGQRWERGQPLGPYSGEVRAGSTDPRDWVTYVHVYPSAEGGINLQYWFFYPYNDGVAFLDHEGDWEHVTVVLGADGSPLGVWAARHYWNAPGVFRPWSRVRRLIGTHPEILAALGSHASYFDLDELPWYDEAGRCDELSARPCAGRRWNTWEGGGLLNLGEREAPLHRELIRKTGVWGSASRFPGRGAPAGPSYQRGWCTLGEPACGMYGAF